MSGKKLLALFSLAVATAVVAQQKTPETPEIPKLVESVTVRLVNVDVVVTDRKGKPVTGLTKDAFIVYDNGQPQKITNFYEIKSTTAEQVPASASAASPAPAATVPGESTSRLKRKFVFFVDNLNLAPFNRNTVFKSMKEFIRTNIRPEDEAMIATYNRDIKVRVPFTNDKEQLISTLDILAGESGLGIQALASRRQAETTIRDAENYDEAVIAARQYAQEVEHDLRMEVSTINGLMTTLAGVDGKKVLVLTTEGLQIQPGRELFYYIDEIGKQKGWHSMSTFIEGQTFESSLLIQSLARTANANGVTVYALHAGGLMGTNESSAENAAPIPVTVQQAALSNSTDSLKLLASMTGGVATVGTNNFNGAFQRISVDLNSYYSLGYSSPTERVDRQRSVEVRAKDRNYVVRARKTFVEKSVDTDMTDRLTANLFYKGQPNDLKIFVTTGRPVHSGDEQYTMPIDIHIPMESLTFLPAGEVMRGGFGVFVVASNDRGDMSQISQQRHPMTYKPSELEGSKGKYYTYHVDLVLAKGRNTISVGVVDDVTDAVGFERAEVLAADLR